MADFDGTDEFFDSREVVERIAELDDLREVMDDAEESPENRQSAAEEYDWDEHAALVELRDEAEGHVPDWEYGEIFYTWDALVEYAEEVVRECYSMGDLPDWVTNHIDWEEVAGEVKVDYTEFEFRGTTYYAR